MCLYTLIFRNNIIKGLDPDTAVIGETHLIDDELIQVEGYICIPHNRKVGHLRSKRNHGGVCILVKSSLTNIAVKIRSDSHARMSLAPVVSEKCPR